MLNTIDEKEILFFIEKKNLMGKGIGFIDVHLLASALLSGIPLWTKDSKLQHEASILGIAYLYSNVIGE